MANGTEVESGLRSRKFLLACAGLVISTGLILGGFMTDVVFVSFNSILAGAYMLANVKEKK